MDAITTAGVIAVGTSQPAAECELEAIRLAVDVPSFTTVTTTLDVPMSPTASVAVKVAVYVPGFAYTCEGVGLPDDVAPSPKAHPYVSGDPPRLTRQRWR